MSRLASMRVERDTVLSPWIGLWPSIFYFFVEWARPMEWLPAIKMIRPGLVAGVWGLSALIMASNKRSIPAPTRWVLAFAILMVYQIVMAQNHNWALYKFRFDFLPPLLALYLPLSVVPNSTRSIRILMTAFFIMHVPTAIHGLQSGGTGLGGWFGDENDLAYAANTAIGVGCFLFLEARSATRKFWLAAGLALLVATTVASFSRGGLVGLVALVGYVFLAARRSRTTIIVLAVIGAIAVLGLASDDWKAEMGTIQTADEATDTGGKRLYYWEIGFKMFMEHPITGVGSDNFGHMAPRYRDTDRYGDSMWKRVAHSLYITLMSEQGLVGIFIYCGMLLACRRGHVRLRRRYDEDPENDEKRTAVLLSSGLVAGLVAALATGTFISVLYYPPIWVLVVLMGSVADVADKEAAGAAPAEAEA